MNRKLVQYQMICPKQPTPMNSFSCMISIEKWNKSIPTVTESKN